MKIYNFFDFIRDRGYIIDEDIGEIGRGGSSKVYKAYEISALRIVAIKKIITIDKDVIKNRFEKEALILSKFNNDGIVRFYSSGTFEDSLFIIMEFIEYEKSQVSKNISEVKLSFKEKLCLLSKVANSLSLVHSKGIVHRDLKPENILLRDKEHPVLVDFGLIHEISEFESRKRHGDLTLNFHVGTPKYMAPEQFYAPPRVLKSTDVWAFGIILFEIITGMHPFNYDNLTNNGRISLTSKYIDSLNNDHSSIELRTRKFSWLDEDLVAILDKCLNKNPLLRYQDATDLSSDFDRYLSGTNTLAKLEKKNFIYKLKLNAIVFIKKSKYYLILGLILLLIGILSLGFYKSNYSDYIYYFETLDYSKGVPILRGRISEEDSKNRVITTTAYKKGNSDNFYKIQFMGLNGNIIGNKDLFGCAIIELEYDEGKLRDAHFFDSNESELFMAKYDYSDKDDSIRVSFWKAGTPGRLGDGPKDSENSEIYALRIIPSKDKLITKIMFLNSMNQSVTNSLGAWGWGFDYVDDLDVREYPLSRHPAFPQPINLQNGVSMISKKYNVEMRLVEIAFLGVEDEPVNVKNELEGRLPFYPFFSLDGDAMELPVFVDQMGVKEVNLIKEIEATFANDYKNYGELVNLGVGYVRFKYDSFGNLIEKNYFDKDFNPSSNVYNVHKVFFEINLKNLVVNKKYFDVNNKLIWEFDTAGGELQIESNDVNKL